MTQPYPLILFSWILEASRRAGFVYANPLGNTPFVFCKGSEARQGTAASSVMLSFRTFFWMNCKGTVCGNQMHVGLTL